MMRIPVFGLVQIILVSALTMQHQDFDPTAHSSWHLVNDKSCGLQAGMKIFGGQDARLGEFPWMVLVTVYKINNATGKIIPSLCGGSIISEKYVLSAAHCFAHAKLSNFKIKMRVGEYDLRQNPDCDLAGFCAPSAKEYLAFKVSIHPDYIAHDPEDPAFPYNPLADIAVVRIDGEFIFSDFVLPICLEYGDLLKQDYAGEIAETVGWGVWGVDGNKLQNPKILQKVSLEVLNVSICSEILKEIPESYICAGTQTQFSYSGDSGSPIFIAKSVDGDIPRQYQIGLSSSAFALDITSWYGGKPPNGYTRVSYFLEWILDQIQD